MYQSPLHELVHKLDVAFEIGNRCVHHKNYLELLSNNINSNNNTTTTTKYTYLCVLRWRNHNRWGIRPFCYIETCQQIQVSISWSKHNEYFTYAFPVLHRIIHIRTDTFKVCSDWRIPHCPFPIPSALGLLQPDCSVYVWSCLKRSELWLSVRKFTMAP